MLREHGHNVDKQLLFIYYIACEYYSISLRIHDHVENVMYTSMTW